MLDQILAHKRAEVARRKEDLAFESVLARCHPSRRKLSAALQRGSPGFLLEIKFTSPSAGTIRPGGDLEPVLRSYGRHADAVSVVTDQAFFGGSLARLAQVRSRLDQPLLCKDFILDPYQVAEARAHGADAVLLILAAIDDSCWRVCTQLAERLGMEVLTEVHDRSEANRAVELEASLIGINSRDLRTLRVDPETVRSIAPGIPADRIVVAESGLDSRAQIQALRPCADAFLVGTALMREPDLDGAVRRFVYGRTKVCGLTRPADAESAWRAGATHGGLVFARESPRRVTLQQARSIRDGADLAWVGVFADHPPEEVAAAAGFLDLHAVQLHGQESRDTVTRVRSLVPPECEVWKAVPVDRPASLPRRLETGADRLLLDAATAGRFGGTGHSFDWRVLEGYSERSAVVLAGGLRVESVAGAAALGTFALDVSSGLESAPGHKDPDQLLRFFAARRRLPGRMSGGRAGSLP